MLDGVAVFDLLATLKPCSHGIVGVAVTIGGAQESAEVEVCLGWNICFEENLAMPLTSSCSVMMA